MIRSRTARPVSRRIREIAVTLFLFACCACAPRDDGTAPSPDEPRSGEVTLRIMSFNIEWGGTHVRFASLAEAIREAEADVVGIQEAEGNLARLANDLGWYYNRRNYVISRYPLVDPAAGAGRYLFVEVAPGRVVAVANVHLPSSPSGTSWLRSGRSTAEVDAMEREVRLPAIEPVLELLPALHRGGIPVFLTGDFNAPSHADWTPAAVGKLPHRDTAFDWPVTRAIADAGFRDSYRMLHPNPVSDPGFTWWAGRPRIEDYNPSDPTRRSRIDYVWFAGPAEARESLVVGEEGADGVDIEVAPWPSDHRAVLSVFEVEPAPMPDLITTSQRVYEGGDVVEFTYHSTGDTPPTLLLERVVPPGRMRPRVRLPAPAVSGTAQLPDGRLTAGHYEASLLDKAGFPVSSNEFWVLEPGAQPTLEIDGDRFEVGDPLPFEWSGAPGNRHDWIGIFPAASNRDTHDYLTYGYVDARSSGAVKMGPQTVEAGWPLPPGDYVARLLLDDGYGFLAESGKFTVTPRSGAH